MTFQARDNQERISRGNNKATRINDIVIVAITLTMLISWGTGGASVLSCCFAMALQRPKAYRASTGKGLKLMRPPGAGASRGPYPKARNWPAQPAWKWGDFISCLPHVPQVLASASWCALASAALCPTSFPSILDKTL